MPTKKQVREFKSLINKKVLKRGIETYPIKSALIWFAVLDGYTLKQIGDAVGLSRERVRQVFLKTERSIVAAATRLGIVKWDDPAWLRRLRVVGALPVKPFEIYPEGEHSYPPDLGVSAWFLDQTPPMPLKELP